MFKSKIKKISLRLLWILNQFGFNPLKFVYAFQGLYYFLYNYLKFIKLNTGTVIELMPCLSDRFDTAGVIDYEYFYQDIFVANLIKKSGVVEHFDIGSRVDGFIAQISLFCNVKLFDIRPLDIQWHGIDSFCIDFSSPQLNESYVGIASSLSCLHTIEHIGLGRYGDPVDSDALPNFIRNLSNVLILNGYLYISFPVGRERVVFDAHRIFNYEKVIKLFADTNLVVQSQYLYKNKEIFSATAMSSDDWRRAVSSEYGLAILVLKKNA